MRVCEFYRRFVWLALALLLLVCALPHAAHAVPWDSLTLGVSPVVDAAQALKPEERAALDARLRAIHDKGLMQAAVVLVDSTDGEPIFDYGMKLAEKWKLGKAGKDDGLLILIAVKDRQYHAFTGMGLEGVLTDVSLVRIQRDAFPPNFRAGNYAAGISAALDEMERRLTADPDTLKELLAADKKEIEGDWLDKLLTWGIVGGLLLFGVGVWFLIIWAIEACYSITRWITAPVAGLTTGVFAWLMDAPPLHAALWGVGGLLLYI
ncbi:MAG: TPM domain-containing protein, partial [Ottowia sp.]|nr:TPM domain-containing protein [Ottowia sp.]